MADLIERDALEAKIRENSMRIRFFDPSVNVILHLIRYAPAVNRWIPVEDALPEIGYSVLVTRQTENNTRYIRTASRQDDCWMDDTDKYGNPNPHQVIAWMPMPDAYESPEKEDET